MIIKSSSSPINIILLALLLSFFCGNKASAADDPNKPNLLLIIADQYRYDMIKSVQDDLARYNGKTKVRTPNLDRLRNQGAYFKNAYTQCSVCAPARGTLRTGLTLEASGIQHNNLPTPSVYNLDAQFKNKIEADVTFEQILVESKGYVAEHYGKWHTPEIFNWSQDGLTRIMRYNDASYTAMTNDTDYGNLIFSFNNTDSSLKYSDKLASMSTGLDTTQYTGMQKDTYSLFPYVTDAIDVRYGLAPYSTLSVGQPDQQGRATWPANRTSTYFEGTAAIGALDRMGKSTEPFVLTADFHNPHAPMIATGLYYDYYAPLQGNFFVPPSLSGADTVNSGWSKHTDPDYQDAVKVKQWMVSYYALCEEVDAYVGKLLDKLEERGIADNTMIVFTSDHGEALGSHGTREKNTMWEESNHVPLLISFPGRIPAGLKIEEPVASLDIFATILDYMNAAQYDQSNGKSHRRFIERKNYNANYDDTAIVTEWDFRAPNGLGGLDRTLGGETNFMSMKGPWKLMITKKASSTKKDMLYNIETDPYEMSNLVGDNGMTASDAAIGKAEHLKALLIEWMQRMDGSAHLYSDPVYNAGEGLGDIAEVTARRLWKTLDIWISDTAVEVGAPANVGGQWKRNEYIYFGRTTAGTLNISSIVVQGADAGLIQLSGFTSGNITSGNYGRVKLTYSPTSYGQQITDARIVINNNAGAAKVITLSSKLPANTPPQITSVAPTIAEIGIPYSYTIAATDLDGNALTYSAPTKPTWLTFNQTTRVLSGTPTSSDMGSYPVTLSVNDAGGSITQSFIIIVSNIGNDAPVINSIPNSTGVIENVAYSYTISASDPDGNTLTYNAPTKPTWLTFNQTTRVLSGTPAPSNVGLHPVTLTVTDGVATVSQNFNIAVFAAPPPQPTNLLQNPSFETGGVAPTSWTLTGLATGSADTAADGAASLKVLYNASPSSKATQTVNLTPNSNYILTARINASALTAGSIVIDTADKFDPGTVPGGTGQFTGRFNSSTVPSVQIRIFPSSSAMTGTAYVDNLVLSLDVAASNAAPVVTSVPVTSVAEGSNYRYVFMAADAETASLSYSAVTTPPTWLSFSPATGVLTGNPTSANVGSYNITLAASDGQASVQQTFTINVTSNDPYITWKASTGVTIDNADNDNDGIANLMEFALGGNPTANDAGVVAPIVTKSGSNMNFTFKRDQASVTYTVEKSTDLITWTPYAVVNNTHGAVGASATVSVPVSTMVNGKLFLRLRVDN
jgi:arylsulfatase A-like enzyme